MFRSVNNRGPESALVQNDVFQISDTKWVYFKPKLVLFAPTNSIIYFNITQFT